MDMDLPAMDMVMYLLAMDMDLPAMDMVMDLLVMDLLVMDMNLQAMDMVITLPSMGKIFTKEYFIHFLVFGYFYPQTTSLKILTAFPF